MASQSVELLAIITAQSEFGELSELDQIVRGHAGEVRFVAKSTPGATLEIRLPRVS